MIELCATEARYYQSCFALSETSNLTKAKVFEADELAMVWRARDERDAFPKQR